MVVQPMEMGSHCAWPLEERWWSNEEEARRSIFGQFADRGSSSPSSLLALLLPPETLVFMLLPLLLLSADQEFAESTEELRDLVVVVVDANAVRLVV